MSSSLELVSVEWKSGFHVIGFALFRDRITNKFSARIETVPGFNEASDLEHVRDYGLKLSFEEARGFFPIELLNKDDYKQ